MKQQFFHITTILAQTLAFRAPKSSLIAIAFPGRSKIVAMGNDSVEIGNVSQKSLFPEPLLTMELMWPKPHRVALLLTDTNMQSRHS